MANLSITVPHAEIAADTAAVGATNFCSLWPAARPALVALAGAISSSLVKTAINIVLAAGDAYCGGPKVGKDEVLLRLRGAGISSLDDLASQIVNKQPQTPMPAEWITNSHIIIAMP